MKVSNLTNSRGNKAVNQFRIEGETSRVFQSYETVIVKIEGGKVYLDADKWDYSKTTAKHRNIFLGETTKETEAKIKSGEYTLTNLN